MTTTSTVLANVVDGMMEATIVPSFSRVGLAVRSRLFDWQPPSADLTGKVAVVTGSSRGIGAAIATALVGMGATVWVTSRSLDRAQDAATRIKATASSDGGHGPDPGGRAIPHAVDMGELDQVRAFAARLHDDTDAIDLLVHNAGALTEQRHETSQGIEATVAAHLVGPWLLTELLLDHLADNARILFMSSGGMYGQGLTLDGLEMSPSSYRGAVAYARAKRAQVVLAEQLATEVPSGVVVHSLHPGWAATGGVASGLPVFNTVMGPLLRTADQAADTAIWLATAAEPATSSGDFWHDRRRRRTHKLPTTRTDPPRRAALVDWLAARVERAEQA